jgi:glutathione peroxidase
VTEDHPGRADAPHHSGYAVGVSIFDVAIGALDGGPANLEQYRGKAVLVVNVASKCGLTPQYASLQRLYETYADRGLVVLAVPCNQFGAQEPGSPGEIRDFCTVNFGITFPITEKVDVNGPNRHELFARLTETPDADGVAGDVRWNFEKFLVRPDGTVAARFRPLTDPLAPELIEAVESALPVGPEASSADSAGAEKPEWSESAWPDLAEARWPTMPQEPARPLPWAESKPVEMPEPRPTIEVTTPTRSRRWWRRWS